MDLKNKRLVLIFVVFIHLLSISAKGKDNRYNILWLSCEDIGTSFSVYGAKGIQTPNIDRLAKEGIRYNKAYATVGVCAPSRASIITGMYPARIGAQHMRTGNHWGYREPEKETYQQVKKIKDIRGHNIPEYSVVTPEHVKCFTEYLRADGYYCTNNAKCDYQFSAPLTAWDENGSKAHFENRKGDQPFFAVFNHGVTHESQIWKKKDDPLLVNPDQLEIPAYFPDIAEVRKDVARKYSNIVEFDQAVGEWVDYLQKNDLYNKTIIFIWSDHGGPLLHQKRAVGNSGLQVPLIVRYPDKRDAGKVVNDIVSLMDLGPTVLSLAGIEPPQYMDGKAFLGPYKSKQSRQYMFGSADRFDEHTDMSRSVIDGRFVYIRNFRPELPMTYRLAYREQIDMTSKLMELDEAGELEGDASYIFMKTKPLEELYDLVTDPYEVKNLALIPKYRDKLIELRSALGQWQLEVGDKGFIPEGEMVNMMWPGGQQPNTDPVQFINSGNHELILESKTPGASIAYQINDNIGSPHWELYSKPISIKNIDNIKARAVRIGYKTSKCTNWSGK
ncbi:choline-sulfatase [Labilibacter sediminis]|nr:choline-sulfatase [Labilibacter sediminis]